MNITIGGILTAISIFVSLACFALAGMVVLFMHGGTNPGPDTYNYLLFKIFFVLIPIVTIVALYFGWRWQSYFLLSLCIWLIPIGSFAIAIMEGRASGRNALAEANTRYQQVVVNTRKDFICGPDDFLNSTEKEFADNYGPYQSITRFYNPNSKNGYPVIDEEIAIVIDKEKIIVTKVLEGASLVKNCRDVGGKSVADNYPGYQVITEDEWYLKSTKGE